MVEAVFNLASLLLGLACLVIWIIALANWDGESSCDESECDTCSFPCDKHTERGKRNE